MIFGKNRSSGGVEWLLVCLGNPGDPYENTRHNVGFQVADEIAARKDVPVQRLKFRALTNTVELGGAKVLLMKPVTYMNLSGEAAREAAAFYKVPPERVLVLFDDISLDVGRTRVRRKGSAGGHNGIKSIIARLGSQDFPRVKIGVGQKPTPAYDLADWVLGRFPKEQEPALKTALEHATAAVRLLVEGKTDEAMNLYNR